MSKSKSRQKPPFIFLDGLPVPCPQAAAYLAAMSDLRAKQAKGNSQ